MLTYQRVWRIAGPIVLANLSVPLLGLVDTAILGHLDDAVYLGSVALGAQLISLLFWSFGFLRMGTTGFTSRALGAHDNLAVRRTLQQSCFFGAITGLILVISQALTLPTAIALMSDSSTELSALALEYAQIRVWAAPASLVTYALVGWLIGIQNSRATMIVLVSINGLNILLDYILVVQFGLNSAGAAWASLASEYLGLVVATVLVIRELRRFPGQVPLAELFDWHTYKEMFTSSRQLFVRTLCLLFSFLFFTSQSAQLGESLVAANAILLNLLSLAAFGLDGFAFAAETLCGSAWGAANRTQFVDACRKTTVLAGWIALVVSLLFLVGQPWILALYTDLPEVITQADQVYLWLALLPLISVWSYQLDGIFIGIGATRAMQYAMLGSTLGVFLPLWWITQNQGNTGLWIALWGMNLSRALFLAAPFARLLKRPAADFGQ